MVIALGLIWQANSAKYCSVCLGFQQILPNDSIILHIIQGKLWDIIATDLFTINNRNLLCIVDYQNKFLIVK